MTTVIIGTYRKRRYIERCLDSLNRNVSGITSFVFVDDSGDSENANWLSKFGRVIETHARGYANAMSHVCAASDFKEAFYVEEDFTITDTVELEQLHQTLWHRPYLAQVALLRQPWFANEIEHGGVIEAMEHDGYHFNTVGEIIEHAATFTCNPAMWRADVLRQGWPMCKGSEVVKRDELTTRDYRFGYLRGIKCQHHGQREGHGY